MFSRFFSYCYIYITFEEGEVLESEQKYSLEIKIKVFVLSIIFSLLVYCCFMGFFYGKNSGGPV
jgi:hypothetical protein